MRQRIYSLVLFAFTSLGLASTGCVSQKILRFEDHPKFPVTSMELSVSKNYYVYRTQEHRFYLCNDAGEKLLCKRSCSDSMDIGCPNFLATAYSVGSNVR
jgi:hypothetical protein